EADAPGLQTRDRRLATFGARLHRAPARGEFHYELETAWQTGGSKLSSAPTATDELTHQAYMHVAHVGYTFDHDTKPRLEALFEMTSGDRDPGDGRNERFDALYGAPRGDLGPTGLFRAIARVNLVSPGVRLVMRPVPEVEVLLMQRFNYLASDRDAWSNGYQDPTGRSGSHIGNLSELRVRYDIVPKGLRFEVGAAYHAAGTFAETAPDAMSPNDALFGYVQTTFWF
ncbi:MAG: alginate export family protein, partial [Planctomycetota bacterium]|nr:alginate export family protein [Planctomycetota bacterium]